VSERELAVALDSVLGAVRAVRWEGLSRQERQQLADRIERLLEELDADSTHTVCSTCGGPADWLWWEGPEVWLQYDGVFCNTHLPTGGRASAILVRNGRGPGWEKFVRRATAKEQHS
jgi:hypothetical protein